MLKKWNLLITFVTILSLTNCGNTQVTKPTICQPNGATTAQFSLATYHHYSAGVLPSVMENGKRYFILSREAEGRKNKYGKFHKYDTFSGSRDEGETHAIETAAHEFLQEGILERIFGWTLEYVKDFLKPENDNTEVIIAYSTEAKPEIPHMRKARNVTYIVHFDKYKKTFFDKFHGARKEEVEQYKKDGTPKSHWTNAEKDRLAKVAEDDLRKAIIDEEDPNEIVTVDALVMNPRTKRFKKEKIELRPLFTAASRLYFLGAPYEQGEHEKIRHYQD